MKRSTKPSNHLGSVAAAVGVGNLDSADNNAKAVGVAGRVGDTRGNPDRPAALDAVGASQEAGTVEGEVAVLVNLPAGALAVAGRGLGAGGVAELALAHAGAVGVELLRGGGGGVEVEAAVVLVQGEGGRVVVLGAVAGGVLVGQLEEDGALGGLEGREVHLAGGAEGHELELCVGGQAGGGAVCGAVVLAGDELGDRGAGDGGDEGGCNGEGVGELHFDGCVFEVTVGVKTDVVGGLLCD